MSLTKLSLAENISVLCKKSLRFTLSPARTSLTYTWPGIIKLFPARESLVSDNQAGDWKIVNLFYSVTYKYIKYLFIYLSF
jgi:hypothetical protein